MVWRVLFGGTLCGTRAAEKIRLPLGVRRLVERWFFGGQPNLSDGLESFVWGSLCGTRAAEKIRLPLVLWWLGESGVGVATSLTKMPG
jgi:hypothetical protein